MAKAIAGTHCYSGCVVKVTYVVLAADGSVLVYDDDRVDVGRPARTEPRDGKYLILPPDYDGDVPDGYFVGKSTSWVNWFIARGFLKNSKPDFSSKLFRDDLKIYPLAKEAITVGKHQVRMEFTYDGGSLAKGAASRCT